MKIWLDSCRSKFNQVNFERQSVARIFLRGWIALPTWPLLFRSSKRWYRANGSVRSPFSTRSNRTTWTVHRTATATASPSQSPPTAPRQQPTTHLAHLASRSRLRTAPPTRPRRTRTAWASARSPASGRACSAAAVAGTRAQIKTILVKIRKVVDPSLEIKSSSLALLFFVLSSFVHINNRTCV